jgi:class 3 adenylate cyclase
VDVRGSTTLAERMSAAEFSRLMNRFYDAATRALIKTDAFIDKLVGDEVSYRLGRRRQYHRATRIQGRSG